ncbi:MAG: hypothetical protein WB689_30310, partial [Xanthobacteraceae bacterium]
PQAGRLKSPRCRFLNASHTACQGVGPPDASRDHEALSFSTRFTGYMPPPPPPPPSGPLR